MADYMIENKMANDRCWPKPKPVSDEEAWDQFERDAKFHSYDWMNGMTEDELRSLLREVHHATWRAFAFNGEARIAAIRELLEAQIEAAFEREAE